jgi:hypothetical protein
VGCEDDKDTTQVRYNNLDTDFYIKRKINDILEDSVEIVHVKFALNQECGVVGSYICLGVDFVI